MLRFKGNIKFTHRITGNDIEGVREYIQLRRSNEKTAYYLKLAKLRLPATIDQI